jgi:trimeric autotransporter adhesin
MGSTSSTRRRLGAAVAAAVAVAGVQLVPIVGAVRASATPAVSPAYAIQDLGVFADGGVDTYATGINNAGVVTGYGDHGTPGFTAFRWSGATLSDLGTLGCNAFGRAINAAGTVVGSYGCTVSGGFQNTGTGNADIGGLSSGPTMADAVNANGQIAGTSNAPDGSGRAFISGAGGLGLEAIDQVAAEPPNTRTIEAFGINSSGDAAGIASFSNAGCGSHDGPFLYSGGTVQDLTGPGSCAGRANALNDSDQVVGYQELSSTGVDHAFLWDGSLHDLGTPNANLAESDALAVNAGGTIVGDAAGSSESLPVAWVMAPGGGMQLLNDLIDPALGWDVMVAQGINDNGQIVGYGAHDGGYHAFVMTPTVAVTLTGIAITPATPVVAKGLQQQFTATAAFSDGSTADVTDTVTWSSSKPKVATIDAAGLLSTLKSGTTTITATDGSVSASTSVKVSQKQLVSYAITPQGTGISPGNTLQFTATGTYTDGSTADITTNGTWKSSTKKVATIGAHTGLAATLKDGTTTISFTDHALPAVTTTLTVTQQVSE